MLIQTLGNSTRRLCIIALLTAAILLPLYARMLHAAPPAQSTPQAVEIERITLMNKFEGRETFRFERGARIGAEVRVRDIRNITAVGSDAAAHNLRYTLYFLIERPNGEIVYDGRSNPRTLRHITLQPREDGSVELVWDVPYDFPEGGYKLSVNIHREDAPQTIEHTLKKGLNIEVSSRYILRSKERMDFGGIRVIDEQAPEDSIDISPANANAGDLLWRVTYWPNEWLQLVEPEPDPTNPSQSIEVANRGTLRLQVRKTVLRGTFVDEIIVSSNANELVFPVSASIDRNAKGAIRRFKIDSAKVDPGERVGFNYRIDNDGKTDVRYRVTFIIQGPSNRIVYDSSDASEDDILTVPDGESSGDRTFYWQVPFGAVRGDYKVGVELRNSRDFGATPFHSIQLGSRDAQTFEVRPGPRIHVTPREWQFGSIIEGAARKAATFTISNSAAQTLQWEVASFPEWIELVAPTGVQSGEGSVVLFVREDIEPGNYMGELTITSNGGDSTLQLAASVRPDPNRTPTATPRPTDTLPNTATPVATPTSAAAPATATPTPEPVATPPAPTAPPTPQPTATATTTPIPTATSAPPAPTATATPPPAATPTPSPIPTATSAPPAPTATVILLLPVTPEPPIPTATSAPPEPTTTATPTAPAAAAATVAPQPTEESAAATDSLPGGACSESPQPLSPMTALVNLAMLVSPMALAAGARWRRRRRS